jgi:flagellar basal body-associated protein FliL
MLFLLYGKNVYIAKNIMKDLNMFDYEDDQSLNYKRNRFDSNVLKRWVAPIVIAILLLMSVLYLLNKDKHDVLQPQSYFYDLGDIVVNLSNQSARNHYLKADLTIYLNNENDLNTIKNMLPVIKDSFQTFLKELRVDDINGSGGSFYIKTELLKRINNILSPTQVKDILVKELLVN